MAAWLKKSMFLLQDRRRFLLGVPTMTEQTKREWFILRHRNAVCRWYRGPSVCNWFKIVLSHSKHSSRGWKQLSYDNSAKIINTKHFLNEKYNGIVHFVGNCREKSVNQCVQLCMCVLATSTKAGSAGFAKPASSNCFKVQTQNLVIESNPNQPTLLVITEIRLDERFKNNNTQLLRNGLLLSVLNYLFDR